MTITYPVERRGRAAGPSCRSRYIARAHRAKHLIAFVALTIASIAIATTSAGAASVVARPAVLSVQATHRSLPGTGGATQFVVRTTGANECRMAFAGGATVTVTFSRAWKRCSAGIFRASVTLGANSGQSAQVVTFRLLLRQGSKTFSSSLGTVRVKSLTATPAPAPAPSSISPEFGQSATWSGYVIPSSSALITDASGQWTVPTLNCTVTPNSGVATWVGIGGWTPTGGTSSGNLLQTGVVSNCVNGVQQNYGWWELWPDNAETEFTSFPVTAGDTIAAFTYQITTGCTTSCGQWETKVEDLTTGLQGIAVTQEGWGVTQISSSSFSYQGRTALSYSGGYTGEWIVEDYWSNYQQSTSAVPFASYGSVTFTNLILGGLSPWYLTANEGVEMVQNGAVVSTPTSPSNGNFSVSYTGP